MSEPDPTLTLYHPPTMVLKPDEILEITLQDGTVVLGRVVSASPPNDDGSVTYTVSWEAGE